MSHTLPEKYKWLLKENGPFMLNEGLKLYGTIETPGKANNKVIMAWAKEIGGKVETVFWADEVPWCGLYMAVVAKRANKDVPKDPLWALNWGTFGYRIAVPGLGDTLVFVRKTSTGATAGHVGIYVGEDKLYYHVLGGNQSDMVNITRIAKSRLYVARRPNYNNTPKNVRRIFLTPSGVISTNEQ